MKAVLLSLVLVSMGLASLYYTFQGKEKAYDYNTTDFIEPEEKFVVCGNDDDCFKFKGSACPAEVGGVEICVNKNFVQEYSSTIEGLAGSCNVNECPQVSLSTNRTCSCIDSKCSLVGELN